MYQFDWVSFKSDTTDICSNPLDPYTCHLCPFSSDFLVIFHKHRRKCSAEHQPQSRSILKSLLEEQTRINKIDIKNPYLTQYEDRYQVHNLSVSKNDWKEATHETNSSESNKEKLYRCDQCPQVFTRASSLKKHKIRIHLSNDQIEWLTCDLCDYRAKIKSNLTGHLRHKHNIEPDTTRWLECDQCDYKTRYKSTLERHKFVFHVQNTAGEAGWLKCDRCTYKTKIESSLRNHQISKHLPDDQVLEWYKCSRCDYVCKIKKTLQTHVRLIHGGPRGKIPDQWYQCAHCAHGSKYKGALASHCKRIHGQDDEPDHEVFQCDQCLYKTKRKSSLVIHTRTAHPLQADDSRLEMQQHLLLG